MRITWIWLTIVLLMTSCLIGGNSSDIIEEKPPYIGDPIDIFVKIECDSTSYYTNKYINYLSMDDIVYLNDTISILKGYSVHFKINRIDVKGCISGKVDIGKEWPIYITGDDVENLSIKSYDIIYKFRCGKKMPVSKSMNVDVFHVWYDKMVKEHI